MNNGEGNNSGNIKPDFSRLVSSLYSAIRYNLGDIKVKGLKSQDTNLEMARFNLDLLEVLALKTEGNLTDEEDILLKDIISEAKLAIASHLKEEKES